MPFFFLILLVNQRRTPPTSTLEFSLDVFLREVNELNKVVVGIVMFILGEIDINQGRKHLEIGFNPVGHAVLEVLGEDARESGIEFGLVWPGAVEFKDAAAEISREGEVDKGDLVFEVHLV